PLVEATAKISDAISPMNGETIHLINTERRVLRAGMSGTAEDDAIQNLQGEAGIYAGSNTGLVASASGVFTATDGPRNETATLSGTGPRYRNLGFDASLIARTDDETRAKNIGADYFMRIR